MVISVYRSIWCLDLTRARYTHGSAREIPLMFSCSINLEMGGLPWKTPGSTEGQVFRLRVSLLGLPLSPREKEYRVSHRFDKVAAHSSSRLHVAFVGKALKSKS